MKRILIFLIALFCCISLIYTLENIDVDSKISHVIIYPEWAYVTRKADVTLKKGITKLTFKKLPTWIDPESIQVKVNPFNDFKIIGTAANTIYLNQISEKDALNIQKKIIELSDMVEDINSEMEALKSEKEYILGLKKWTINKNEKDKEGEPGKISLKDIQDLNLYIKNTLNENLKKENELKRNIRAILPELEANKKKWSEMQSIATLEQKEITIEIESNAAGQVELFVSYLISGASWYPIYDSRSNIDSKTVELEYCAVIQQSTGEDWTEAQFRLSTIRPYLVREIPELNPWYVDNTNIGFDKSNIKNNFSRSKSGEYEANLKTIQEKQRDYNKLNQNRDEKQAYENYQRGNENFSDVIRQVEERGTTVEFNLKGTYTVKTDGKSVKMIIDKTNLEASKRYSAIPSISMNTYVTGTIKNDSTLPFLPGIVSVYKNGNFIGKSKINFVAEKEKFELFMGLEERIKISRTLDVKKSSSSILSSKRILRVGYIIEIQNFLNDSITIDVSDQIPVSQNNSIKIKLAAIDPKIDKNDKGVLTWKIEVNPSEKKSLYFEFEIEYPKDFELKNAVEIERYLENMK